MAMKKTMMVLLMVVLLAGILYPQGVHAKLKKGIYFSGLTGKRKDLYSDINIKKLSMKANRLIVYGKFQYSKSMKNFWAGKRVNLKYKKTVFPLKKKCKMISSGGEGRPDKLTKKSFLKLAKLYNGLGLSIVVDKNGKVTSLKEVNVMNYKILDCDVIKQDGDTVYWTTQSGKNRLWSHMGKIRSKSGSHLNMS